MREVLNLYKFSCNHAQIQNNFTKVRVGMKGIGVVNSGLADMHYKVFSSIIVKLNRKSNLHRYLHVTAVSNLHWTHVF